MTTAVLGGDSRIVQTLGDALLIERFATLPTLEVPAGGAHLGAAWAPVAGATAAVVDAAPLQIGRSATIEGSGALAVTADKPAGHVVALPAGAVVRSLTLGGHFALNQTEAARERLAVAARDADGRWAPLFAIPDLGKRGALPPILTGARLTGNVLSLPDVRADKLRLSIVSGAGPEAFVERTFTPGTVTAQLLRTARDVTVKDAGGATLWTFPGELPDADPPAQDLRVAVQAAFAERIAAGQPPALELTLTAAARGRVGCSFPAPRGALLRVAPAPVSATLAGAGAVLDPGGPPLAAETPAAVHADVRVVYDGLRLLEQPRDAVPPDDAFAAGQIVQGAEPVLRTLAPELFCALAPGRLSLVGRSPEGCTLSVTLQDAEGTRAPLAPAVSVDVPAGRMFALVHVDLAPLAVPLPAAAIAVRTTSGRFLWQGDPEPAVQIAVHDPDPAGRPVRLAGRPWLQLHENELRAPGADLDPRAFTATPPVADSDLFVTVTLTDLTLRYAR